MKGATQLNEILEGTKEIPSWMVYGRTVLCQKDLVKRNSVEYFRPITCVTLMWELLTVMISEDMCCFMENENLLPEDQKGCRRKSRGTKDQLLIDNFQRTKKVAGGKVGEQRISYWSTRQYLKIVEKEGQILLWRGQIIERPMILSHIAGFYSVLTCLALLITSEVFLKKSMKKWKFFFKFEWVRFMPGWHQ